MSDRALALLAGALFFGFLAWANVAASRRPPALECRHPAGVFR